VWADWRSDITKIITHILYNAAFKTTGEKLLNGHPTPDLKLIGAMNTE
jgi:hypothetical protein